MATLRRSDPRRGEIWLVDFDPTVGGEVRKTRPADVISSNAVGRLPLRIVVPITEWKDAYFAFPWFVEVKPSAANGLSKDSGADTFQVKSVALERFREPLGSLTAEELDDVAAGIALCVGLRLRPNR